MKMPKQPHPFDIACTQSSSLQQKYDLVLSTTSNPGDATRLRTFEAVIQQGCPAINMTLAGCIRFLESGKWLSIYEAIALEVGGANGSKFEKALREKLGDWYQPRTEFDRVLGFRTDTHYAALNIGGCGPDYGECCVRFGRMPRLRVATCFVGDPLQVVFDEDGVQLLSRDEVLDRFSAYLHRTKLATVHIYHKLPTCIPVNLDALIEMLDDRRTLIEVQIHGAVRREHAVEIALRSEFFDELARCCVDFEGVPDRDKMAKQFARVRLLKRLLKLTDQYGLRLRAKR